MMGSVPVFGGNVPTSTANPASGLSHSSVFAASAPAPEATLGSTLPSSNSPAALNAVMGSMVLDPALFDATASIPKPDENTIAAVNKIQAAAALVNAEGINSFTQWQQQQVAAAPVPAAPIQPFAGTINQASFDPSSPPNVQLAFRSISMDSLPAPASQATFNQATPTTQTTPTAQLAFGSNSLALDNQPTFQLATLPTAQRHQRSSSMESVPTVARSETPRRLPDQVSLGTVVPPRRQVPVANDQAIATAQTTTTSQTEFTVQTTAETNGVIYASPSPILSTSDLTSHPSPKRKRTSDDASLERLLTPSTMTPPPPSPRKPVPQSPRQLADDDDFVFEKVSPRPFYPHPDPNGPNAPPLWRGIVAFVNLTTHDHQRIESGVAKSGGRGKNKMAAEAGWQPQSPSTPTKKKAAPKLPTTPTPVRTPKSKKAPAPKADPTWTPNTPKKAKKATASGEPESKVAKAKLPTTPKRAKPATSRTATPSKAPKLPKAPHK